MDLETEKGDYRHDYRNEKSDNSYHNILFLNVNNRVSLHILLSILVYYFNSTLQMYTFFEYAPNISTIFFIKWPKFNVCLQKRQDKCNYFPIACPHFVLIQVAETGLLLVCEVLRPE